MKIRRLRRKVRCLLKYGPHGCPHIERHSRRPKRRRAPSVGRHGPGVTHVSPADLVRQGP